jgi:uncharacterized protein (DUF1501 family)
MADCTCIDRRSFLKLGGMTLVISAVDPSFARADGRLRGLSQNTPSGRTFVYVFQRFGADGLNIVVPTEAGEYATYQSYRPTLAVPMASLTPQQLTPDFALHPSAASLHALYLAGNCAVFPNVGYPNGSRSHFDSQLFMDNGTPYDKTTRDGWLNRYLQNAPPNPDPLRAIAFGSTLPVPLVGPMPALSFTNIASLSVTPNRNPTEMARDQKIRGIHQRAYLLPTPGREYDTELRDSPAAQYPATPFGSSLSQLAQLLKSGAFAIELAEVDLGGWDTHSQQGAVTGAHPGLVQQLADGIKAFNDDLGPLMDTTVVTTLSEFGRTARENGNRGTDHGSAWASFAVGGRAGNLVRSGVYGTWMSLTDLRDNRDLKYSLDFRDVLSEVLSRHLGTLSPSVFPGWTHTPVGFLA